MSAFEEESNAKEGGDEHEVVQIDLNNPTQVIYHPESGLPAEFCEFSETFAKDLPWIMENCPDEVTPDVLAKAIEKLTMKGEGSEGADGNDKESSGAPTKEEKQRGEGIKAKKAKAGPGECRVVISRIQRQKKKFITAVTGMETVPDVKLKDVSKFFGKKFASGAALSNIPGGGTEIVIQGDVQFDLPEILIQTYNVPATSIMLESKEGKTSKITPYQI
jgi:density-regulated protein